MTFNHLSADINCSCLLDSVQKISSNAEDVFCRKMRQNNPGPRDFESNWEKNRREINGEPIDVQHDCSGILSLKAVSINAFNDQTKIHVLEKYRKSAKGESSNVQLPAQRIQFFRPSGKTGWFGG